MENPYQAPESRLDIVQSSGLELAGRGTRLGAVLIDGLIMMVVLLPLYLATGMLGIIIANARNHQSLPFATLVMWSIIGVVAFTLIQGFPLASNGQTWGKKALSIRIVTQDGSKPSIGSLIGRYAIYMLPGKVPLIGGVFSLVNICFIFRADRRCIHDLAAGTRVVVA